MPTPEQIHQAVLAAKVKPAKAIWEPKIASDFSETTVLAFDQTINHTGLAMIAHTGSLRVRHAAYFPSNPKDGLKSFEATLTRTRILEGELIGWLSMFKAHPEDWWPAHFVHEMPAVHGFRTESSLMAAYAVRKAVWTVFGKDCLSVANLHAKAVLLGPGAQEKANVKPVIDALIPERLRPAKPWNEHIIDATMIGLTHLYDLKAKK